MLSASALKVSQMEVPRPPSSTAPSIWYDEVDAPQRKSDGKSGNGCPVGGGRQARAHRPGQRRERLDAHHERVTTPLAGPDAQDPAVHDEGGGDPALWPGHPRLVRAGDDPVELAQAAHHGPPRG